MINYLAITMIICTSIYSGVPSYGLIKEDVNNKTLQQEVGKKIEEVETNEPIDYVSELKKIGYYKNDSEDDNLNIRNAVLRFQSNYNLNVDGTWNTECIEALNSRYESLYFVYKDIVNEPPTQDKWITINKTKHILTLYKGKEVLQKFPIAIGNPPSLTPEGKFKIVNKLVNPMWGGGGYTKPVKGGIPENPLGYRWMGLSVGGGGEYGIHGNNKPYSIGTNASLGCIRMINSDVENLFEIIPNQTPVWIGTDEKLMEWGVSQQKF